MSTQSLGSIIASLRKEKGMTQRDLAQKMGATDKAVSKWERNLSFPDIASLPLLAEQLGISVEDLLEAKVSAREKNPLGKAGELAELVLKAIALAMGIGVTALTIMDEVEPRIALCLLGIGVACLALVQLSHTSEEKQ